MESKFDYHVLTMDEIVFDHRNKAYGAFVIRRVYDRNLLKAIILSMGLFVLGMSSPAILKRLGIIVQRHEEMNKIISCPFDAGGVNILPPKPTLTKVTPSGPKERTEIMEAVEKDKLNPETKPEEKTGTIVNNGQTGTGETGTTGGGETGGNVTGTTQVVTFTKPDEIITHGLEEWPEFPGGDKAFDEFIDDNINYPEPEKEDGIEGIVKVQFVVNKNGSIEQIRISQSSGNRSFDAEALRVVRLMPKYKPGKQNGHAVRVLCVLPIGFEID